MRTLEWRGEVDRGTDSGATYTNWDNLLTKWSGNMRWWETHKDWSSFACGAEEISIRLLKKDKKEGYECHNIKMLKNEEDEDRKKGGSKEKRHIEKVGSLLEKSVWSLKS